MARTKLTVPPILQGARFDELLKKVVQQSVDVAGKDAEAGTRDDAPVNTGRMRRQIRYESRTDGVGGRLIAAGESRRYADVQDKGRRPGARGPSTHHLLYADGVRQGKADTGQTGWTQRQMPGAVESLAAQLRAGYMAKLKTKRTKRKLSAFKADARFVLSRAIARRIHRRGMEGKSFVTPGDEVVAAIKQEFGRTLGAVIARLRSGGGA